jgi:hypothetical protein
MASIISAGTSSGTALNMTGDTSGNLAFQTGAGANTITVPNVTGTILTTGSAGTVLQVVQGIKTDTFSTTAGMGTPATITGLSAAITPRSTSNKVLITVTIGELGADADTTYNLILFRDSTAICLGDAAGSRVRSSAAGGIPTSGQQWRAQVPSFTFLDTPSTTSAVTYTVKVGGNTTSTITINYDFRNTNGANDSARVPSTITLQEVAG